MVRTRPGINVKLGRVCVLVLCLAAASCAPRIEPPGPAVADPALSGQAFSTADGARLPLHRWQPEKNPARAVLIALHGFNDYGNFIAEAGAYFAQRGILTYAYDQRGFGGAPNRGLWPGIKAFTDDLKSVAALIRARHPGTPLFILGESMGGAVLMTAMTGDAPPRADGIILSAPAVWGRSTMPWVQRSALWLSAHTVGGLKLTGQSLKIKPSNNIEMLRALGRDPRIIKETRIDTLWGLAGLMDAALAAAPRLSAPALILYGRKDQVIPAAPTRKMLKSLPPAGREARRIAYYENGYHMLLRDLDGETVWADIAAWIADRTRPLPSGADRKAGALLRGAP
ncbi:MAG: lysophospholipase [Rhodospirillales bacterium]|nr:lysophospholipase [Rhodospirillales bacterium]